jgi:hypothetical protein
LLIEQGQNKWEEVKETEHICIAEEWAGGGCIQKESKLTILWLAYEKEKVSYCM